MPSYNTYSGNIPIFPFINDNKWKVIISTRCLQCDTRANQAHLVFAAQKNAFAIKPKELDSRPTHLKTTK